MNDYVVALCWQMVSDGLTVFLMAGFPLNRVFCSFGEMGPEKARDSAGMHYLCRKQLSQLQGCLAINFEKLKVI